MQSLSTSTSVTLGNEKTIKQRPLFSRKSKPGWWMAGLTTEADVQLSLQVY